MPSGGVDLNLLVDGVVESFDVLMSNEGSKGSKTQTQKIRPGRSTLKYSTKCTSNDSSDIGNGR